MAITAAQAEVLNAAPISGQYVLGLGNVPGRWMWFVGQQPVTRHVNALVKAGLLMTDAQPYNGNHPVRRVATAARVS